MKSPVSAEQFVHRAAFVTKSADYEKPLRVQPMLGAFSTNNVFSICIIDSLDCRNCSSVDHTYGAVDISSSVGYQEGNQFRNFFGATGAVHGNPSE